MQKHYLEVEITKTVNRDGVEYAHITGTHGLAMWVPTSDLTSGPKAAKEPAESKEKPEPKPKAAKEPEAE